MKEFWKEKSEPVVFFSYMCLHADRRILLFVILWTVAHQSPLYMKFYRQEYVSRLSCPPPGDLTDPRNKPSSPALQADIYR